MAANVAYWNQAMTAILDQGAKIDQPSRDFLAKAAGGDLFKDALTKINELATKIAALPKLELDEIAKRLQQENIVVVENKSSVRGRDLRRGLPGRRSDGRNAQPR